MMEEGYRCIFSPTIGQDELEDEYEGEHEQRDALQDGDHAAHDASHGSEQADPNMNARPFNLDGKEHYLRNLKEKDFVEMCGYNFSKIPYPFKSSTRMQSVWIKRQKNEYDFPSHLFLKIVTKLRVTNMDTSMILMMIISSEKILLFIMKQGILFMKLLLSVEELTCTIL